MHFTAPVTLKEGMKLDIKSGKPLFFRKLSGSFQAVVRRLSGGCQAVVRRLLGGCQAIVRQLSGGCQAVIRWLSGAISQGVIKWSLVVIGLSSGKRQAFRRQLSGSRWAFVRIAQPCIVLCFTWPRYKYKFGLVHSVYKYNCKNLLSVH